MYLYVQEAVFEKDDRRAVDDSGGFGNHRHAGASLSCTQPSFFMPRLFGFPMQGHEVAV